MMRMLICSIALFALGHASVCCVEDAAATKAAVAKLKPASLPGTRNVHVAGNVVLAGQPRPQALSELSRSGVKTVISLRREGEERFDEAAVCQQLGMKFIRLPISNPDDLNKDLLNNACKILKSANDDSGVVLHCASANRVGAVWLAHRIKEDGLTVQQAREEAKRVGLKTRELEAKAPEYAE